MDEGFDLGRRCVSGQGQCRTEGTFSCTADGRGTACDARAGLPVAEACDGLDNDCDGEIDEEIPAGDTCEVGLGECLRRGELVCGAGGTTICDAEPEAPGRRDLCNGRDEDCDGTADEDYDIHAPCWVGVGQCEREGTTRCTADSGAACDAIAGLAAQERCNSLDDDCDGATDEAFDVGDLCSVGVGACRTQGFWMCDEAGVGQICNAPDPVEALPETCNGRDDDCDGLVDEIFDVGAPCAVGIGECRREAQRVCGDGAFTVCPAQPGPRNAVELCDGLDDDCDAATDEGYDVGGFCRVGEGACVQVGALHCSPNLRGTDCGAAPLAPTVERCNDIDDDCDGNTDEPPPTLLFPLAGGADGESGTLLGSHDDGSFIVAAHSDAGAGAGGELSVAVVDCAWSVLWRVDLPDSPAPLAIADAPPVTFINGAGELEDGPPGIVLLEGDADRSLVALDAGGPRWRLNLGPAEEIGGMAPVPGGYALVVRDEVQILDHEGRQSARWPHGVIAADPPGPPPAIAEGPGGTLLLHWSDPATGDGVVRRVNPDGEEVWTTIADSGPATTRLTPRVRAVAPPPDASTLLTGLLEDDEAGSAAWLGILDDSGELTVERGSPFYAGCVAGTFASDDASQPVLRCVVPQRILFLHPDGLVRRGVNLPTAAMARDPFGRPGVVLVAVVDPAVPEGLTFSRLQRPD